MSNTRFTSLVVVFCLLLAGCSALVPLIGWSNSDVFSSVRKTEFSSANDFLYEATLDNVDIIVIFKSPKLSFDGLTKYGGVFGANNPSLTTVQSELKSSKSSVWAGVGGNVASDLVSTISFILNAEPDVVTGADGLTASQKFIQVELLGSSEDQDSFSEHDAVINEVMAALHALPNSPTFAAIYTSGHAHLTSPRSNQRILRRSAEDSVLFRVPRDEGSEDTADQLCTSILSNGTNAAVCMIFCFTKTNITRLNSTSGVLLENITDLEFVDGGCGNQSEACSAYEYPCINFAAEVNDTVSDLEQLNLMNNTASVVNLTFVFPHGACLGKEGGDSSLECGFWFMELYVNNKKFRRARESKYIFSPFSVANGSAYACGNNSKNIYQPVNSTGDDDDNFEIHFSGLQVQVYSGFTCSNKGSSCQKGDTGSNVYGFGSVSNCQGYLTVGSLMGVIAVVLLILILYCSVVFMFSINSVDRFDDPRGPTISVENLH